MHEAEAARLFAVAENFQRLVLFRGGDEARQHHAVASGLARADGVEQPRNDDGQFFFARVGERDKFIHELRAGVAPARMAGRPDEQVVVLAKLRLGALAINFRGGSQQQRRGILGGGTEQNLSLVEAGFQNVQRGFHNQINPDGCREVKNKFRLRRELRQFRAGGNFGLDETQARIYFHRPEIFQLARRKIVNNDNAFAVFEQTLHEVPANEAGAARDQNVFCIFHLSAPATASASFSRNSELSIFAASCGLDKNPPSISTAAW